MSKTITFVEAQKAGIILPDHYIMTTAPKSSQAIINEEETGFEEQQKFTIEEGEVNLWRVNENFILWGEPTKQKLVLKGKTGDEQGVPAIHKLLKELYAEFSIFEQIYSCCFPKRSYFLHEIMRVVRDESKKYQKQEDMSFDYWIASSCRIDKTYGVFYIKNCDIYPAELCDYQRKIYSDSHRVRPVAIPVPTLTLEIDGFDGSKENPWRCIL